jgi:hypothetical protein
MDEHGHLWREPDKPRRWSDVDWAEKYSMAEVYLILTAGLAMGILVGWAIARFH